MTVTGQETSKRREAQEGRAADRKETTGWTDTERAPEEDLEAHGTFAEPAESTTGNGRRAKPEERKSQKRKEVADDG